MCIRDRYIKSRTARHIAAQFRDNPAIDTFHVEIDERDAFAAIFATGGSVRSLRSDTVNNLDKAIANVQAYAAEVIAKLKQGRKTL